MQPESRKRPNYFLIFVILAAFTVIETLVSYVQQAAIKLPVLFGISIIKAALVLLYFMHLRSDSRLFSYLFIGGLVLAVPLILIVTIVMPFLVQR